MGWNTEELTWIAIATAGAVLLVVGAATTVASVRFRRHRNLIAETLARMSELVPPPASRPRLRGLGHDVVEVLARQEGAAGTAADLALLIAADAATTTVERIGFPAQPEDTAREMGAVQSVCARPQLQEVAEQMARSSTRLIVLGHMVLGQGERFGLLDEDARGALAEALEGARLAVRAAECEDPLAALTALTAVDIPVPESGFPGQAVADELRVQVRTLAQLGIRRHTALADHGGARSREERR